MIDKTILIISPEAWGTNFVSKHHYANYLAKNNTIYFLNPVISSTINPFGKTNIGVKQIKKNLVQVNYQNLLPKLNLLPKFIQNYIYKKQAQQIQKALNINEFDIVWSFDPNRFWNQEVWQSDKTIYHTVDFHPNAKYETEICKKSDTILGVTPLINNVIENRKRIIHRIGHGADIDGFNTDDTFTIPGINNIKACYTGNFHKHLNYTLLIELAVQNYDIDFIMIGPIKDNNLSSGNLLAKSNLERLSKLKNVFLIGSVPSNQLMNYLHLCDINLVLFKKEFETVHCSPHKLMAYFYSGNVTVSNYIDEHKDTDSEIILMLNDVNDVDRKIKEIKFNLTHYNSEKQQEKRKQYAIQNSYDNKIKEISNIIYNEKNHLKPNINIR